MKTKAFFMLSLFFTLVFCSNAFAEWRLEWDIPEYVEEKILDDNGNVIGVTSNKPTGYRVYFGRTDSGDELGMVKEIKGFDVNYILLRDLPLDGTNKWTFVVTAYNPSGESERSNQVFLAETHYPYKPPNPPILRLVDK